MLKKLSSGLYLLGFIFFFTPWWSVSCMDRRIISTTGIQNATGFTVQTPDMQTGGMQQEQIPPQPLVIGTLLLIVVGLISGFIGSKSATIAGTASGFLTVALMLFFKSKIDARLAEGAGMGMITLVFETGFWATMVLSGLAALMCVFAFQSIKEPARTETAG